MSAIWLHEMTTSKHNIKTNHRFLDEAGDSTFYGKKRKNIIGTEGVSNCFILGLVKFKEPLEPLAKAGYRPSKEGGE